MDATIPHTNRQVAAMIQIQRYTGMRPGEVTIMRGCDLDRTGKVWFYRPASHKTEHHGRSRVITLGPKAQQAVKPFLKPDEQAYLFSPKDVHAERSAQRRMARQTPMTPSQAKRRPKAHPRKAPGDRYTTGSYEHVIYQACDKAFPVPKELNEEQAMQWRKDHRWAPNQLRHTAATFLRKRYGLEAARVILGHSTPAVTEIYAELDQARAVRIMGKVG